MRDRTNCRLVHQKIRRLAARHGRSPKLPWIFSSLHATFGATETEARRKVSERVAAIDFERGRALVEDMLGGGIDLSSVKLDETVPVSLIPDVKTVNGRRGRVDIFSRYAARGYTLRELVIAAQDTGHWSVAGTPEQIADAIEERFNAGVLDVVSLGGIADDRQHEFVVDGLLSNCASAALSTTATGAQHCGRTSACLLPQPPWITLLPGMRASELGVSLVHPQPGHARPPGRACQRRA
ncbi:MAG: hypothetical protein ACRDP7_02295 [Trebonia sp.]